MKTDDLIKLLATNAGAAPQLPLAKWLGSSALFAVGSAAAFSILLIGLVPQELFVSGAFQIKLAFGLSLGLLAVLNLNFLAKPAARNQTLLGLISLPLLGMTGLGGLVWLDTPDTERMTALLGHSWLICPWAILGLSVPGLVAGLYTLRKAAPTRLRLTGAVCGLMAGGLAATGYALACTETSIPFVALWYSLGIALSVLLGALIGPKVLAW